MKSNSKLNYLILLGLSIFIFIPNLRIFFKYTGDYAIELSIVYFIVITIIFISINNKINFINMIISKKIFLFLLAFIVLIVVWYFYPIADGLKEQMRGSDQDDCIIMGVNYLLNFENPYQSLSYYGNKCSPGPGILIPYISLVYLNIYSLGAPLSILFLSYMIYKRNANNVSLASTYLVIMFSSLFLFELMVVGSDLIVIGVGIALLSIFIADILRNKNIRFLLLTAVLAGIIASTRINFLVIIFISSSYIFVYWRKGALLFFIISSIIAILPSFIIYLSNPEMFTPLHLIGKSSILMTPIIRNISILLSIIFYIYSIYKIYNSINYVKFGFFITLLPSLLGVSLGDLIHRSGEIAIWEGANYLMPLIPLGGLLLIEYKTNNETR